MAYTVVSNLTESFYNSLRYFLITDATIDVSTVWITHPDLNISNLVTPFILIRPWDRRQSLWVMPDNERLAEFYFDLWIACTDYAQQRHLPLTAIRQVDSSTAEDADGTTVPGIQVYYSFDTDGAPDTDTKLCAADITMSSVVSFEISSPEEANRKYMSIISCTWERVKDKDKEFITT